MKPFYKEYLNPIIIITAILALTLILHLELCSSTMRSDPSIWVQKHINHQNNYPFNLRFPQTQVSLLLSDLTGLNQKTSFFAIQFALAFLIGTAFYKFLRLLKFSRAQSNLGVVILMLSYPMIGAHFEPVQTWDDFWAYLFLILTFYQVYKRNLLPSVLFFTMAMFAREQSVVFYPALASSVFYFGRDIPLSRKISFLMLPVICYGAFFFYMYQPYKTERFSLIIKNFETLPAAKNSFYSIFISFGFVWVTAIIETVRRFKLSVSKRDRLFVWNAIIVTMLNLIVALFFTSVRETRILFPPFIFLIPLSLTFLKAVYVYLNQHLSQFKRIFYWVLLLGTMALSGFLIKWIIPSFEYRQCPDFCYEIGGINLGLSLILLMTYVSSKKMRSLFNSYLI